MRSASRRQRASCGHRSSCWPPVPTARRGSCCAVASARSVGCRSARVSPTMSGSASATKAQTGCSAKSRRSSAHTRCSWPRSRSPSPAAPAPRACLISSSSPGSTPGRARIRGQRRRVRMKPASRGSVRLHSSDPRAPLRIDHGFLSDPDDATVLAEGVESLRRLAAGDAVRRLRRPGDAPGSRGRRDDARAGTARGFFHPSEHARSAGSSTAPACLRARRAHRRRRVDHADDPTREHQPLHVGAGRATRGEHGDV